MTQFFSLVTLVLSFFLFGTTEAAVIQVGAPPASIQTAVDSANPGDTVQLSSGTYIQEVLITKNLTLQGNGQDISIIQCPATTLTNTFTFTPTGAVYHPFVMVQGATVTIQALTIDGDSQASDFSNYRFLGIGYHNADGTVTNVRATNVQDASPGGPTQHGQAIFGAADDGNPHTLNVTNCTVDHFQKAGIDMRGNPFTVNISGNTVTGETPPSNANANGIVVQFGAVANIDSNTVTNLISVTPGTDTVGILVDGAGANSTITNNTSNGNNIGIDSQGTGANLTINGNTVNNSTDIGINVVDNLGLTTIQQNILTDNMNYGMQLQNDAGAQNLQLGMNQFIGGNNGLGVVGSVTDGPIVTMNADSFTGTTTYYIQETNSPHNIWTSTATVSFDGLISGHITLAEYNAIQAKLFGNLTDPALGIILEYITPVPPVLTTITPNMGPTGGGTTVTITGSSFISSNTQVFFGGVLATSVTVVSNTEIIAVAPPGTGSVDVTVVTPFGTTPIVADDLFTYVASGNPLPPTNFTGILQKKIFHGRCRCVLTATWTASTSTDVVSYRIYKKKRLVKKIAATDPLTFKRPVKSRKVAKSYFISAVSSDGLESEKVRIRLLN